MPLVPAELSYMGNRMLTHPSETVGTGNYMVSFHPSKHFQKHYFI